MGDRNMLKSLPARPEPFGESFAKLEDWIAGSLECYKAEIMCVSFPLFALCYFRILDLQQPPGGLLASQFLRQWGGNHALHYPTEMRAISAVTCREHLEEDEYARLVLGRSEGGRARFQVTLSRVSSELLHAFISANELFLLAILLNGHVDIAVEDREPVVTMQVARLLAPQDRTAVAAQEGTGAPPSLEFLLWGSFSLRIDVSPSVPLFTSLASPLATEGAQAVGARIAPISESARVERTFLGTKEGPVPFPSIGAATQSDAVRGDEPATVSVLENLMQSTMLHPPCAYPGETASSAVTRADPVSLVPALKPSVYFTTFVNAYRGLVGVSVTRDATQLAASFSDRAVRVWRLDRQTAAIRVSPSSQSDDDVPLEIKGHSQPVYALSWSPEQRYLLTGGGDGAVRLSDVENGQSLVSYQAHASPVWDVAFCPLGHYFLSGSHDRTARLWATDHAQPLRMLVGHLSDVTATAFHPNCNYAFTGSADKTVRLWDVSSGKCLRIFAGHFGAISDLAVCPSGQYLASASEDSSVRIWDVASSKQVGLLRGHAGSVYSADYSSNGAVLASGGADSSIRIWDVAGSFGEAKALGEPSCSMAATRTFHTKATPVVHVKWSRENLLMASGGLGF
jgi:transcription initiation factor TFIID subunit 5